MGKMWSVGIVLLVGLVLAVGGVDRSKFRTCAQTDFCKRFRPKERKEQYKVDVSSVTVGERAVDFTIVGGPTGAVYLSGQMSFLHGGPVRLRIKEKTPIRERYENKDILEESGLLSVEFQEIHPSSEGYPSKDIPEGRTVKVFGCPAKSLAVVIHMDPFRIDYYIKGAHSMSFNARGLLHFEHYREKPSVENIEVAVDSRGELADVSGGKKIADYSEEGVAIYEDGTVEKEYSIEEKPKDVSEEWEETFQSHVDTKPLGPSSVGIDVTFPGSDHVYGIPEHATDFSLKNTFGDGAEYVDPFRLYSLDVFKYELDSPMALYGHIPFMVSHSLQNSAGVFVFNPTETFVDVESSAYGKQTHWISESGVIDVMWMPGPTAKNVLSQYAQVTGASALPPLWSIAYHQCRWNYRDETDVSNVNEDFERYNIPLDVIWLDIEHTDEKRYFTWDKHSFPNPERMIESIASYGRKMVTIVDPHIKRDPEYYIHAESTEKGLYIKDKSFEKDFDGWCWPGSSSYLDFTSEKVRRWWAEQFAYNKYHGSASTVYTWNDMNEPSVFNGPEVSMSKDCLSLEKIEHRQWHSLYGLYMQRATAEGLILRNTPPKLRPFVLSRSFFAGSQQYGAIWTGDNEASWEHLEYSTKMILSVSIAGLPFVGADVGGFFGDPDIELLERWYMAAVYQPFFRAHAHHDSQRREPSRFEETHRSRIRGEIMKRYQLLPYMYTLFEEAMRMGIPVNRPLWLEFPAEENLFGIDDTFMLGAALLVKPVVHSMVTAQSVILPSGLWYAVGTGEKVEGGRSVDVHCAIDQGIPVFQRGGTIVPRKLWIRRSSMLMKDDPLTLYVAVDENQNAAGHLYLDDESSFDYKNGIFRRRHFRFADNSLTASAAEDDGTYGVLNKIERLVIYGLGKVPAAIKIDEAETKPLEFSYQDQYDALTVRKLDTLAAGDWKLTLQF